MITEFNYSVFTVQKALNAESDWRNSDKIHFISTSSKDIQENTLFVPLLGNRDGHEFIEDALKNGAKYFLCNKNHPILERLTPQEKSKAILVKDTLKALGLLARFHRNRFTPIVVAVTGSSGKTTTKELLVSALSSVGTENLVATEKNYNNEIGLPFTLFRINEKTKIVICELGMNHEGELKRLSKISAPDYMFVTNVGPAHIEFFGSVKSIAKAKSEVLLGANKKSKLYIPSSIDFKKQFYKQADKKDVQIIEFSLRDNPTINVDNVRTDGFDLSISGQKFIWNLPGLKILSNLFGVIEIALDLKIKIEDLIQSLSNYKPTEKRLSLESNQYHVLNDTYNANPDSMLSSLQVISQMANKEKVYAILGDMKELGDYSEHYHKLIGKLIGSSSICGLITFGTDSRWMLDTFRMINPDATVATHFENLDESIPKIVKYISEKIGAGSFILIKGSRSMQMERICEALANAKLESAPKEPTPKESVQDESPKETSEKTSTEEKPVESKDGQDLESIENSKPIKPDGSFYE